MTQAETFGRKPCGCWTVSLCSDPTRVTLSSRCIVPFDSSRHAQSPSPRSPAFSSGPEAAKTAASTGQAYSTGLRCPVHEASPERYDGAAGDDAAPSWGPVRNVAVWRALQQIWSIL